MKDPVVIIGIGELGGVFARGLLRGAHPVYPITRDMNLAAEAAQIPSPRAVVVAVAEDDLHAAIDAVPGPWRERIALLQNELLPRDWQLHHIDNPTVICVWFEKKKGRDPKVILPSPVFGPNADILCAALQAISIPARKIASHEELLFELVRKNVYILTINIAGLVGSATVHQLWREHQALARAIADDVITIQERLNGAQLPRERLIDGMLEAFAGDPDHKCLGRTALTRLQRAVGHADAGGLAVPKLREILAVAQRPDDNPLPS